MASSARAFAAAHVDLATAYTVAHVGEAIGLVLAARSLGLPIAISFTVETDGRLPSGDTVARRSRLSTARRRPTIT